PSVRYRDRMRRVAVIGVGILVLGSLIWLVYRHPVESTPTPNALPLRTDSPHPPAPSALIEADQTPARVPIESSSKDSGATIAIGADCESDLGTADTITTVDRAGNADGIRVSGVLVIPDEWPDGSRRITAHLTG